MKHSNDKQPARASWGLTFATVLGKQVSLWTRRKISARWIAWLRSRIDTSRQRRDGGDQLTRIDRLREMHFKTTAQRLRSIL